uniref:Uncharacterized protein n=1 Tax=Romanomermis culicivorax TaxID=13658 RepID=A0A915KPZ5_ROMCU
MPKKKEVCNEDEEPENDLELYDILVATEAFGKSIVTKDIKDARLQRGMVQLSNNIQKQNIAMKDHHRSKISHKIVPVLRELHQKGINSFIFIYFLWPHSPGMKSLDTKLVGA